MADPISLAGIGLGAASLTAQAFVGCMQAIQLILKASGLEAEFRYLKIRLQLERQRLWNWSEISGLLDYLGGKEDALDANLSGLNRHLILEVVFQIQTVVTGFIKVKGRYQDMSITSASLQSLTVHARAEESPPFQDDVAGDDSDLLQQFPGSRAVIGKLIRSLEITQQLPKRLRWAAWDQDKFKVLIDRLKELNDCLLDLVDNSIRMQIFLKTKETNIGFLGLHNKMDDLRQLFLALARDPPINTTQTPTDFHARQGLASAQNQKDENTELLDLTRFKALSQSMEYGSLDARVAAELQLQQPDEQMRDSKLRRADIVLQETDLDDDESCEGLRCEARYRDQSVWVEWKEYQPVDLSSPKPKPDANVLARVQRLAALLRREGNPAVFRVPQCLGYFDDAEDTHLRVQQSAGDSIEPIQDEEQALPLPRFRFGFVFAKPVDTDPSIRPVSLFELLKKQPKPCLTERVALAKTLADCIRYLHSVDWLHKGLRSHNVIFVPQTGKAKIDYSKPYVSGFDYARPAWRDEMTEAPPANPEYDIYKHPRILRASGRQGYKKPFDIYSLGIIFMEIAEWKSIDIILNITDPKMVRAPVVWAIRDRLLNEDRFIEEVGASMGRLFKSSVRYCLESSNVSDSDGRFDETFASRDAKLSKEFYEYVVKNLEDIKC